MIPFRKPLTIATLAAGLIPFTATACSLSTIGQEIQVGDPLRELVEHAGRPASVDFAIRCMNDKCSEVDTTERWVYMHGAGRHVVGVLDNKVTSIEHHSPQ